MIGAVPRLHRIVRSDPPTLDDFTSDVARGRPAYGTNPDAVRLAAGLSVFITEAQSTPDSGGWTNASPDWIRRVYDEINLWNTNPANQPIQCLLLFRWHTANF